jgi:RNA polymerase sigma-70 factor (ECF subfamily)
VTTELIDRAKAGDDGAFAQLVEPHRRELEVHCYRMLGSAQDAEDTLQETLLAAWQAFAGFEGRASVRTWLYRIATNRCLNARRATHSQPPMQANPFGPDLPEPSHLGEVLWLEPYPDPLEGIADPEPGPEARYGAHEAMSLAFVTALQLLAPLQRAVIVLRDVLGFRAAEVAQMLDTTEESVTSALKRARANVDRQLSPSTLAPPPAPNSATERALVEALTAAYEAADLDALIALLTEDVLLTMPPVPLEYQGHDLARRFLRVIAFTPGRRFRLVPTVRANGQLAFGFYVAEPATDVFHGNGLLVFTLSGDRVSAIARFESSVLARFGLPRSLPFGDA